jgi:hypothetical protein
MYSSRFPKGSFVNNFGHSSSLSEKWVSPNINAFGVNFEHDKKIQNR